jgi:hypothetical protein
MRKGTHSKQEDKTDSLYLTHHKSMPPYCVVHDIPAGLFNSREFFRDYAGALPAQ